VLTGIITENPNENGLSNKEILLHLTSPEVVTSGLVNASTEQYHYYFHLLAPFTVQSWR
jgi:hypothetical protein